MQVRDLGKGALGLSHGSGSWSPLLLTAISFGVLERKALERCKAVDSISHE